MATLLIVFIGYGQLRRKEALDTAKELRRNGYVVEVPSGWRDNLWQFRLTLGKVVRDERGNEAILLKLQMGRRVVSGKELELLKESEVVE